MYKILISLLICAIISCLFCLLIIFFTNSRCCCLILEHTVSLFTNREWRTEPVLVTLHWRSNTRYISLFDMSNRLYSIDYCILDLYYGCTLCTVQSMLPMQSNLFRCTQVVKLNNLLFMHWYNHFWYAQSITSNTHTQSIDTQSPLSSKAIQADRKTPRYSFCCTYQLLK